METEIAGPRASGSNTVPAPFTLTDALDNLRDFKRHTVKGEAQSGRNRIRSQRQVEILWFQDVVIRLFDVWSSEVWPSEAGVLGDVNGEAQILGLIF